MRITLVGPGKISIPPKSWGAVEMLIYDQATKLKEIGHEITIVNEEKLKNREIAINKSKPEVIHFHYDQHIYDNYLGNYQNIYFTSHFPYTPQYAKYTKIFKNPLITNILKLICKFLPNRILPLLGLSYELISLIRHFPLFIEFVKVPKSIKLICLSNEISEVYKSYGYKNKTFIHKNSAREDLIKFKEIQSKEKRAICIGLIQRRKNQFNLSNISCLYFVGPIADKRFKKRHPRYLGDWTRKELYKKLSNFSSLVLLSEGEAHALVTSEALLAGLGLVLSEEAVANLDLSKEFIDVIPNKFKNDIEYIEKVIEKNIYNSIKYRKEIREYGLENFSMTEVIQSYPPILKNYYE